MSVLSQINRPSASVVCQRTLFVRHVIAGITRRSGGPSYSVPALCSALTDHGANVTVRTLAAEREQTLRKSYRVIIHSQKRGMLSSAVRPSTSLRVALREDFCHSDIVHCHGLWLMPNVYPAWARQKTGSSAKLVHSPRGMLGADARRISAWKKTPFWWLLQHSALGAADCLHATAESEYEEIRSAGLRNPVTVIPNGIELPDLGNVPRSQGPVRTAISLGRVHPKKGLDRLVRAWAGIESSFPDWRLRIIGPAERDHDKELRALAASLAAKTIRIEGPLFGADRLEAYRQSDLFVLPTLNENFAMTVAEALSAEVPVISTKGAPWPGLVDNRCGWWIEHGAEPLQAALRNAMTLPRSELESMGALGRRWMARDFGWDSIASSMLDVYSWLTAGGDRPSTVRTN